MYPHRVGEILKLMSFSGKPQIIGSASLRSIQYIGDYDTNDNAKRATPKKFQKIIKSLMRQQDVYIGDIKCGDMDGEPIRWTAQEVLKGVLKMGDHEHTLEDSMKQEAMFKLDVVALIEERYIELSMVYQTKYNYKVNKKELVKQLKVEIETKEEEGMYYKMAKRMFSVARLNNDATVAQKLIPLFNGDLGRLYAIISDIEVLLYLFENKIHIPKDRLKTELDNFKARMGSIWELKKFIKNEQEFIDEINIQIKNTNPDELLSLQEELFFILNFTARKELKALGVYPPPKRYLP